MSPIEFAMQLAVGGSCFGFSYGFVKLVRNNSEVRRGQD